MVPGLKIDSFRLESGDSHYILVSKSSRLSLSSLFSVPHSLSGLDFGI